MWLPVLVLLFGLLFALFGHAHYIGAWPPAFGIAVALLICILAAHAGSEQKKFFAGLALTFFASAVALGIFAFVAVYVAYS